MADSERTRLVFHASVILIIALACGVVSVAEVSAGTVRMWQAAHNALLLMGLWLFAEAAILGFIVLKPTELLVLTWSMMLTGYSLSLVAVAQAIMGVRALGPSNSPLEFIVFIVNVFVVLGSFLSASLTLMGARNAIVAARNARAPNVEQAPAKTAV